MKRIGILLLFLLGVISGSYARDLTEQESQLVGKSVAFERKDVGGNQFKPYDGTGWEIVFRSDGMADRIFNGQVDGPHQFALRGNVIERTCFCQPLTLIDVTQDELTIETRHYVTKYRKL